MQDKTATSQRRRTLLKAATLGGVAIGMPGIQTAIAQGAPMKVRMGYIGDFLGASMVAVANKLDLWKKHNLAPEIKVFTNGPIQIQALGSGDLDFGFIGPGALWLPITGKAKVIAINVVGFSDRVITQPGIKTMQDLKGKTVAASAPGTNPHFTLAWILKKNGMSLKDVKLVTLEPAPAANAFVTGTDLDAAVTYEPYLSLVRDKPETGKLIADSLQYPMVFDSFGCTPKFIKENPKAVKALVDSYFQALEMIEKDKVKAFTIMGADVKQTAEQFEKSQAKIKWADRAANKKFFSGEIQAFNKEAAELLLEIGVIKTLPANMDTLFDTTYLN